MESEEYRLKRDIQAMSSHIQYLENRIWELEHLASIKNSSHSSQRSFNDLTDELERKEYKIIELEKNLRLCNESLALYKKSCKSKDQKIQHLNIELEKVSSELNNFKNYDVKETRKEDSLLVDVKQILIISLVALLFVAFILFVSGYDFSSLFSSKATAATSRSNISYSYDYENNYASSNHNASNSSSVTMVWVDNTAKRYHKKNGCNMDNAYQVTKEEAIAMGKTPCGNCY